MRGLEIRINKDFVGRDSSVDPVDNAATPCTESDKKTLELTPDANLLLVPTTYSTLYNTACISIRITV